MTGGAAEVTIGLVSSMATAGEDDDESSMETATDPSDWEFRRLTLREETDPPETEAEEPPEYS